MKVLSKIIDTSNSLADDLDAIKDDIDCALVA